VRMNISRLLRGNRNADPLGAETQPPPAWPDISAQTASVRVRPAHEKLGKYITRSPTPIAAFVPSVVKHGEQLCFHSLRHHLAVCLRNKKFINTIACLVRNIIVKLLVGRSRPPFKSCNADEESTASHCTKSNRSSDSTRIAGDVHLRGILLIQNTRLDCVFVVRRGKRVRMLGCSQ
jgi:hypothetical protein